MEPIGGLTIGQMAADADGAYRVVAIDPDVNTVEAEDATGQVVFDTIDHFVATHRCSSDG
jgi:predicted RNA methylase